MRQAEAIKPGIERLIAARGHALRRPAPAAIRRVWHRTTRRVANPVAGEAIREKREAIVHLAARHGAIRVRLIGSVARGDARPDSDADLLVTCSERTSLLDQAALMHLPGEAARSVSIGVRPWALSSCELPLNKALPAPPGVTQRLPGTSSDGVLH